jgi:hypothetical protein
VVEAGKSPEGLASFTSLDLSLDLFADWSPSNVLLALWGDLTPPFMWWVESLQRASKYIGRRLVSKTKEKGRERLVERGWRGREGGMISRNFGLENMNELVRRGES